MNGRSVHASMALWSMDGWAYLDRQVVTDPRGRQWTVALMDLLGQQGDPAVPSRLLEAQFSSGRYFTLIYSPAGAIQWERGHAALEDASREYRRLLVSVFDGTHDPRQPVFKASLDEE